MINTKLKITAAITALIIFSGCRTVMPVPDDHTGSVLPEPEIVMADESMESPDSRMIVSGTLTTEGYRLLSQGDPDGAIRILERAVGLNPSDGPGYYYLAEAWLRKEKPKLARQFNRLAIMYLRNDQDWTDRAKAQKHRIVEAQLVDSELNLDGH